MALSAAAMSAAESAAQLQQRLRLAELGLVPGLRTRAREPVRAVTAVRPRSGHVGQPTRIVFHSKRPTRLAAAGKQVVTAAVEVEKGTPAAASDEAEGKSKEAGGCPSCGRDDIMFGCDGKGRIQGGLGAVPGFRWWPIKAYRPCPAFVEAGGKYRRQGQSLDEVAFGRKAPGDDLSIAERFKKLEDPSEVAARLKKLKEEEKAQRKNQQGGEEKAE